ncbi:hypothetical protein RHGRI_025488 [Rhododendron griersonianum]|uniref:Poly(A) RNA polymerase mitochondrial-like central palm domain-containing protein n=1 Tax=Rhododendron griersonianum TaxID=479676 RepID=A0AAV6ISW8_9ERIC|nr:hypothetical protein RHGRI_025488 [Rhododendron griersonianum]
MISGVLKKVKKLELKGTQKNKINSERIPALEEILLDVYAVCHPRPIDYFNRKDLVRVFNAMAKEIYGNSDDIPVVEEFGSFLMDIFSPKSDLDLSVNFTNNDGDFPQEKKIQSLRKFAKKLYALRRKGHLSSVQPILSANVPILKIVDRGTGIECDISIENRDGILKSQVVRMISSIDGRFQKLCFLMKAWAKAHGINSSRDRTLNSLSIISLVAFHLQTRDPPILPPFSAIFEDGIDSAAVGKMINNLLDFGKMNKESLGELFITLLVKVEDFTDRSLNVARVVGKKQVEKINKLINRSIYYVSAFMEGQIQGSKLRALLFGSECIPALENRSTTNVDRKTVDSHLSLDPTMTKKMRNIGGWGEPGRTTPFTLTKIVHWGGPPMEGWDGTIIESWGGEGVSIHLDQIQPNTVQSTIVWRGPPVEGWRGQNESIHLDQISTVVSRGRQHESMHLDQIQRKAVQSVVVWRGPPVEGWGEEHESIHLDQIQQKPVPSTAVQKGPPVKGWGGEHESIHLDQTPQKAVQSTVVWRGTPVEGWGEKHVSVEGWGEKHVSVHFGRVKSKGKQSIVVWGGTPVEGWGPKHVSTQLDQIQPKGLQATEGWGGIQQATLPEPIRSNGTQSADGWGQWGGDNASCSSTKHLSIPAQKRIGIRKSSRQDPNTRRRLRSNGYRNL